HQPQQRQDKQQSAHVTSPPCPKAGLSLPKYSSRSPGPPSLGVVFSDVVEQRLLGQAGQVALVQPPSAGSKELLDRIVLAQVELDGGTRLMGGVVVHPRIAHQPPLQVLVTDDERNLP